MMFESGGTGYSRTAMKIDFAFFSTVHRTIDRPSRKKNPDFFNNERDRKKCEIEKNLRANAFLESAITLANCNLSTSFEINGGDFTHPLSFSADEIVFSFLF